jgi:hypothetical protein
VRSIWVAYLLWFLFGPIGVHRFYCGKIGTGILWFFTGGLFAIGWIVDAFLLPRMVRRTNEAYLADVRRTSGQAIVTAPPGEMPRGVAVGHRVIYCTYCGSPLQVPAADMGKHYACPACRTVLTVPG